MTFARAENMKNGFFVLIIYMLSQMCVFGQGTKLFLEAENPNNQVYLDSLTAGKCFTSVDSLKRHAQYLIEQLQRDGYLSLVYKSLDSVQDGFRRHIDLGKKYDEILLDREAFKKHVKRYDLEQPESFGEDQLWIMRVDEAVDLITSIQDELEQRGFAFAKAKITILNDQVTPTPARLEIQTLAEREITKLTIRGYEKFPRAFIPKELKSGVYNREKVERLDDLVNELVFVSSARSPQVRFTPDSTEVYLTLRKESVSTIDALIGFTTLESGQLDLTGHAEVLLKNTFNQGEEINLRYRDDEQDQSRIELFARLPYVLSSPIGVSGNLEILRRDSTYNRTSYFGEVLLNLNQRTRIKGRVQSIEANSLEDGNFSQDVNSTIYSGGLEYQIVKRDSRISPSFFRVDAVAGTGSRSLANGEIEVVSAHLSLEHVFKIASRWKARYYLEGAGLFTEKLQFNELYQIGGPENFRGVAQNSIDTGKYAIVSTELRFLLGDSIYLHTILDGAAIETAFDQQPEFLYAYGLGSRLLTRAGILGIGLSTASFGGESAGLSNLMASINLLVSI